MTGVLHPGLPIKETKVQPAVLKLSFLLQGQLGNRNTAAFGQDRTGQDRTGQDRTEEEIPGHMEVKHDREEGDEGGGDPDQADHNWYRPGGLRQW